MCKYEVDDNIVPSINSKSNSWSGNSSREPELPGLGANGQLNEYLIQIHKNINIQKIHWLKCDQAL